MSWQTATTPGTARPRDSSPTGWSKKPSSRCSALGPGEWPTCRAGRGATPWSWPGAAGWSQGSTPRWPCYAWLDEKPSRLDLVTLILGLEFLEDPGAALDEARRVLRAGGLLVVAILTAGGAWTLWRRLKRRLVPSLWRRARFFSEAELEELLRARGFACRARRRAVCYVPLVRSSRLLAAWERIGRRLTPRLCAFFVVQCEVAPSRRAALIDKVERGT